MSSQDLDPTVRVSRVYEGKLIEAHKPYLNMAVPDSVEKFNLRFDYSVFETPYMGTDVFRPYILDLKPESGTDTGSSLMVRAGAGYSLHPTADIVWSPRFKAPFSMSLYGRHHSYFGKYRAVSAEGTELVFNGKDRYKGYDAETSAGVAGRAHWNTGYFAFDAGYYGVAGREQFLDRNLNALRTNLRVSSYRRNQKHFLYDVSLDYVFTDDRLDGMGADRLREHNFGMKAVFGPMFAAEQGFLLDAAMDLSVYSRGMNSSIGDFSLTPKYVFRKGRWDISAGVKVAVTAGDAVAKINRGQYVYPAVNIGFEAIRSYMEIYLNALGGNRVDGYTDIVSSGNRRFGMHYMPVAGSPLIDISTDRVDASFGLKGNIASRFGYDLRIGYRNVMNGMLDAVLPAGTPANAGEPSFRPAVAYADYQWFSAALDCEWHSEDVRVASSMTFGYSDLEDRTMSDMVFAPAWLNMNVDAVYNWNKRIYVGLHCSARTARHANLLQSGTDFMRKYTIPGYADLGVSAEYKFSRKWSCWIYGGNLLNMTIQRVPLYTESGISFTAGFTFAL